MFNKNSLQRVERSLLPKLKISLAIHIRLIWWSHGKQQQHAYDYIIYIYIDMIHGHNPKLLDLDNRPAWAGGGACTAARAWGWSKRREPRGRAQASCRACEAHRARGTACAAPPGQGTAEGECEECGHNVEARQHRHFDGGERVCAVVERDARRVEERGTEKFKREIIKLWRTMKIKEKKVTIQGFSIKLSLSINQYINFCQGFF